MPVPAAKAATATQEAGEGYTAGKNNPSVVPATAYATKCPKIAGIAQRPLRITCCCRTSSIGKAPRRTAIWRSVR